ncbi:MAG: hypothetical protein ACRCYQ_05655, partial [Nocardioides sp.]
MGQNQPGNLADKDRVVAIDFGKTKQLVRDIRLAGEDIWELAARLEVIDPVDFMTPAAYAADNGKTRNMI